jgi:hypothetical protein
MPRSTGCVWKSSNITKPSKALCGCRTAGWWQVRWPGSRDFDDWLATEYDATAMQADYMANNKPWF